MVLCDTFCFDLGGSNCLDSLGIYLSYRQTNFNLNSKIFWDVIGCSKHIVKCSKTVVNKGFSANNSFHPIRRCYAVLPLLWEVLRAKSRARIIKILCFDFGKRTVASVNLQMNWGFIVKISKLFAITLQSKKRCVFFLSQSCMICFLDCIWRTFLFCRQYCWRSICLQFYPHCSCLLMCAPKVCEL